MRVTDGQRFPGGSVIIWGDVQDNIGQGYNTTTGKFVAPSTGTYRFTVTVMNSDPTQHTYMVVRLNRVDLCVALVVGEGDQLQTGLCSRVVHLEAGMRSGLLILMAQPLISTSIPTRRLKDS